MAFADLYSLLKSLSEIRLLYCGLELCILAGGPKFLRLFFLFYENSITGGK